MLLALFDLAVGSAAHLVEEYKSFRREFPAFDLTEMRDELWEALTTRALRAEVEFRGVRAGGLAAETIPPMALRGSKPDFQAHTLEAVGTIFHGVGVFHVRPEQSSAVLQPAPYRTGASGRPTSKAVILSEMRRRQSAGKLAATIGVEASTLSAWLAEAHPEAPAMKPKSVADAIRDQYRKLCRNP